MRSRKLFSQVFKIIRLCYDSIGIAHPVFITNNNTATQTKIPCKETIQIKVVHVFICIRRRQVWVTWYFSSLGIYISKPLVRNVTPIMSCTQRKIGAGSEIERAGKN